MSKEYSSPQTAVDVSADLSAILSTVPDGVITIDARGIVTSLNTAAERMFGYSAQQVIGKNVSTLMPQPYRGEHDGYLDAYKRTGKAKIIGIGREVEAQRADGSNFPIELAVGEFERNGQRMFVGVIRDITEKHKAAAQVKQLASIVESTDAAIYLEDTQGVITSWNRGAEQLYGYLASEMLGQHVSELVPPESVEETNALKARIRKGRRGRPLETTRLHKDGTLVDVALTASPVRDANGKLEGISCISRDISDIKAAEDDLRRSAERVRAIVETVPDGIITIDAVGRIAGFNPAAERLFGYSAAEVMGKNVKVLMPEPYRSEHDGYLQAYRQTGQAKIIGIGREVVARRKDGSDFPIELAVGEMLLGEQRMFAGVIRDISERKKAEADLMRLNESLEHQVQETQQAMHQLEEATDQLVQTEKLAPLGGLVAGISHEINTPIGVGITAASTLEQQVAECARQFSEQKLTENQLKEFMLTAQEASKIILSNLRRAAELVMSFKQVAVDQTSSERRQFNCRHFLDEVLISLRPELKRCQHKISIDCPADLELDSYPGAWSQILTNLVFNALIHGFKDIDQGHIRIALVADEANVELCFEDDGRGIAAGNLSHIFDPFFTTNRGAGGSGLGLHLVYNLVKKTLQGHIEVDSEPGRGTRFTMTLPRQISET